MIILFIIYYAIENVMSYYLTITSVVYYTRTYPTRIGTPMYMLLVGMW